MSDSRRSKRYKGHWSIFTKDENDEFQLKGHLLDISGGGARFLLKDLGGFEVEKKNPIKKILLKMDNVKVEPLSISVKVVWINKINENPDYEVGVEFIPATAKENVYIQTIMKEFEKAVENLAKTDIDAAIAAEIEQAEVGSESEIEAGIEMFEAEIELADAEIGWD